MAADTPSRPGRIELVGRATGGTTPGSTDAVRVVRHEDAKPRTNMLLFARTPPLPASAHFRAVRHKIAAAEGTHVVMVTAPLRTALKSPCAANVAMALAETRKHQVLLIDAQVRRPELAALFGVDDIPGLTQQLDEIRNAPETPLRVEDVGIPCLHLLLSNPAADDPDGILDVPLLNRTIGTLRARYDYIVIDAPAVADGPEVDLLISATDGVIFVARAGTDRARHLRSAADRLTGANVLGVVLTDVTNAD